MQGKELPEPAIAPVYAGIDVCKDWLDVYVHPQGQRLPVSNDRPGLRRLKRLLCAFSGTHVMMEATGKHHRAAQRSLHEAGLVVSVVNPLRARLFCQATGHLAKTDAIDARLLALMGAALEPEPTPPPPLALEELRELVNARRAATAERTALVNRLATCTTAFLRSELMRRITACQRHIARLDAEVERRIQAQPEFLRRSAILRPIPGVGPVTAAVFLSGLAELGRCSGKQAAMLAGLAPVACDSGDTRGRRSIRGGRQDVRDAAYMAALAASRYNPDLAGFVERLRNTGKPAKVVLTAVMRNLVVLANTFLTQNRCWSPNAP